MAQGTLSLRTRLVMAGLAVTLVVLFTVFSLAESSADGGARPPVATVASHAS